MSFQGSIWGPPRPKSYLERLKEEQELRDKQTEGETNDKETNQTTRRCQDR